METTEYQSLIKSFKEWLIVLGYAQSTVYGSTNYVRDFFIWLENNKIYSLKQINKNHLENYKKHLENRKNKRKTGGLSHVYIFSNFSSIRRFSRYLQLTGKYSFEINISLPKTEKMNVNLEILSKAEIKALYKACGNDYLGIRDRAILSIYYGCGLRRSEGRALNVADILLKEKRVFVRKGKNYKERYVPITEAIKEDLENYIYTSREKILSFKKNRKTNALFIGVQTNRLSGNGLIIRVQKLLKEAKIQKQIGLHTLRHSIATHLLQSGLSLEEVSQFLGHSSLESTQIYTHIANE